MLSDAVLADLRPLPSILRVLTNALEELPSEWTVHRYGDAPPLVDPANDATAVMAIRRATGDGRPGIATSPRSVEPLLEWTQSVTGSRERGQPRFSSKDLEDL